MGILELVPFQANQAILDRNIGTIHHALVWLLAKQLYEDLLVGIKDDAKSETRNS